jgi:hypothetical protein
MQQGDSLAVFRDKPQRQGGLKGLSVSLQVGKTERIASL